MPRLPAIAIVLTLLAAGLCPALAATKAVPDSREQIQLTFAPVVHRTQPAVVNIFTKHTVRTQGLFADPMFRQFFGDTVPFGMPQERIQNSLGSGVIVRPDGMIVTNHHVIKDADEIRVVLADRREFDATLLRSDDKTDLALLRIDAGKDPLPFLELRDSDDLEVGDLVLAIGNPFGVGQTVTSGIVSALARTTRGITDFGFFIQTDAAINPGNSGGALVTLDGKLAGVNTAIYSRNGGSIGIGFAIPSNMVRTVIENASTSGHIVRPWLGASGQAVTADMAASLGMARPRGVILDSLYPEGPAQKAGLQRGDVLTEIDGRAVDDPESLRFRIATQPVGKTVTATIDRRGQRQALPVALVAPPETPARDSTALQAGPFAGAIAANLSPALADELGMETGLRGVVVTEVKPGTPAARIGMKPGDIVARVNDRDIGAVRQLVDVVPLPGKIWRVVVKRGADTFAVTVQG